MKREIKFRGLRIDGKSWVYGSLAAMWDGEPMIMPKCYYATRDFGSEDNKGNPVLEDKLAIGGFIIVIPESVGQYTGLKDKGGKEIYEGDLVNYGVKSYYNPNPLHKVLFGYGSFYLENIEDPSCNTEFESPESEFEVIGNIHEPKTK